MTLDRCSPLAAARAARRIFSCRSPISPFPAALAWLLLTASALLLRRFGGGAWPILLPIIAMTLLDYMENADIWILLLQWPDMSPIGVGIANIAGVAMAFKRVLGIVAFSTPIVLSGIELVIRGRRRVAENRQGR